jgi:hypothetical protein
VVRFLASLALMAAITKRLKVGVVESITSIFDGDYVVDHLGRMEAMNADRITPDKPSPKSLPFSGGIKGSVPVLCFVEGPLATGVQLTASDLDKSGAAWECAGL